jgi:cbb3-type cytochrome oxidase cytochrome c subunit
MDLRYISPDPLYSSIWFVYHNYAPSSICASSYMPAYNNWVNNKRLFALANARFARKIKVGYDHNPTVGYGWENFRAKHYIDITFVKQEFIPQLFSDDLSPIIE